MNGFNIKDESITLRDKLYDLAEQVKEHDPAMALRCFDTMRQLIEALHKNRNGGVPPKLEKGVAALFSAPQRLRLTESIQRRKAVNGETIDIKAIAIPMEEANGNGQSSQD